MLVRRDMHIPDLKWGAYRHTNLSETKTGDKIIEKVRYLIKEWDIFMKIAKITKLRG